MAKKPVAGTPAPVKNSTPPATPVTKPAAAPKPAPAKAAVPAAAAPKPAKAPAPASAPVASTAVRNSPLPKTARPATPMAGAASSREVTQADIAKRAYEIWASGQGGSETDNWLRAERELRGL